MPLFANNTVNPKQGSYIPKSRRPRKPLGAPQIIHQKPIWLICSKKKTIFFGRLYICPAPPDIAPAIFLKI
jgi:hypothetical protein